MKRLRSSEDLHSYGDKNASKDSNLNRSFSSSAQRSFYYKPENGRKGLLPSSSSRYDRDRTVDEDREGSRLVRKRSEHDFEGFDRRKGFDRYRDSGYGGGGGDRNLIHRSESFCGSRRDFPKGFRSERDRSRREGSVSSWRRGLKDFDESGRGSRVGVEERVVRSPKGLRDVKSPTWSKDSESEQSKKRSSSPRGFRDAKSKSKSPTWSKDSESEQSKSEQSKSVEVKKTEELQVQSGNTSEMEEGELEPEPLPQTEPEAAPPKDEDGPGSEDQPSVPLETDDKKVQNECQLNDTDTAMAERQESSSMQDVKPNEDVDSEVKDAGKEADKLPDIQDDPPKKMLVTETEHDTVGNVDDKKDECLKADTECKLETKEAADMEKPLFDEEEHKQDKGVDLETSAGVDKPELNYEVSTEYEVPKEVSSEMMMENVANNAKDKGKRVSVALTDVAHSSEEGLWIDRGSRDLTTSSADVMETPSTRGFELFSRSPVRKVEKSDHSILNKQKDDSLGMEQLDLTLSLPNVLLPIGAQETTTQVPGSPSQARSVQSLSNTFCTNSDGFTASMSFSGSQSFHHNPSCSLTKNSVDYEQSVGSRPLFQGIDQVSQVCWQGQSQSEPKQKEVPFGQRTLMNGNGSLYQSQASWGVLDGQAVKGHNPRVLEGSSKMGSGLERQLSFHKQVSGQSRRHEDVRSPSQSVGSHDIGSNHSFEKKREVRDRSSGSLYRTTSQKEQEQLLMDGVDFVETIIARIVSDPVHAMSRKFHEMTGQSIACLKEGIREIMLNAHKHGQILAFQKVLQNRSDITLDDLLKCHRVQLEILVALKTCLTHFLHLDNSISSSDLAQVFLNLRCRNLSCLSQLPVDECDCKVCVQKNGFCRECMCLVCSKFDNASNTCSWVGCDVCLHWCHTECGLRESYIRNGHSSTGTKGMTEMQFHCIACDHPSEMFGFVKEVFQNFAKDWSVETLCKELEYVKRIFFASKDMRGRQLHDIADQMLLRLLNKSNHPEVLRHIMSFLSDGDSAKLALTTKFSGKEQIKENNGVAGPSQEAAWLKTIYSEKPPLLERPANILPTFDQNDKRTLAQELQMSRVQKDFGFDELESVVKIKQAEAKMFQSRADDARREAEGLKRIAVAKNEKIEEEYTNRIAKLRLTETEEMRKQKIEELQALDRAHMEYLNMKKRMERDIEDLLSKMEAAKMSLAM
ncbi:protein OBERON 4 [Gastrolobium bilobum]|uniref:protein OBERON 4 n=1 Tax=Gastrolobium bilobum TaxID=150636 RepID=UPI002AAF323D|nr:protein OBERON 4 [Gastrolobium bilobum]